MNKIQNSLNGTSRLVLNSVKISQEFLQPTFGNQETFITITGMMGDECTLRSISDAQAEMVQFSRTAELMITRMTYSPNGKLVVTLVCDTKNLEVVQEQVELFMEQVQNARNMVCVKW